MGQGGAPQRRRSQAARRHGGRVRVGLGDMSQTAVGCTQRKKKRAGPLQKWAKWVVR
jgi:hypothetical protein